jgi:membrane associated rhomboid family serine protease
MIPIGDDNRANRSMPYVVVALLVSNIAVFIYELTLSQNQLQLFISRWGLVPAQIVQHQDLAPYIAAPFWVTIFTSMFIHGGWLHIGGNMLYLWVFGDNVEDVLGHFRFLLFYFISGVGAAALQILVDTNSLTPIIGASGALSGVLAAYLIMFPRRGVRVLVFLGIFVTVISLPAILVIGFWVVLQFLAGVARISPQSPQADNVAYFAHIGGFLSGAALLLLMPRTRARAARQRD